MKNDLLLLEINIRECRGSNQEMTIHRHWRIQTQQKHNTICVGHHHTKPSTNNLNKTCALLQTNGGKDEPNIVFIFAQIVTDTTTHPL